MVGVDEINSATNTQLFLAFRAAACGVLPALGAWFRATIEGGSYSRGRRGRYAMGLYPSSEEWPRAYCLHAHRAGRSGERITC